VNKKLFVSENFSIHPKQILFFLIADQLMPTSFCDLINSNQHVKVRRELTQARHIPVDIRNDASQSGLPFYLCGMFSSNSKLGVHLMGSWLMGSFG
jgi:hypothetical protein